MCGFYKEWELVFVGFVMCGFVNVCVFYCLCVSVWVL